MGFRNKILRFFLVEFWIEIKKTNNFSNISLLCSQPELVRMLIDRYIFIHHIIFKQKKPRKKIEKEEENQHTHVYKINVQFSQKE